jgi:tetratricopeptide (TPR) repeat protein
LLVKAISFNLNKNIEFDLDYHVNGRYMKKILHICLLISLISFSPMLAATKGIYCGELTGGHYGPFDYLNRFSLKEQLDIVEYMHFTPDIENLVKGNTGPIAADLNYTLHAWPNHHRALTALAKLSIRDKTSRPSGAKYPVECYFDRAIRFKSDDGTVRMIYGGYLSKTGKPNQAIEQLEIAVKLLPDNAIAHYNLGILYLDKKEYSKAKIHAEKAYALDFPLPGLRNRLKKVGAWKD